MGCLNPSAIELLSIEATDEVNARTAFCEGYEYNDTLECFHDFKFTATLKANDSATYLGDPTCPGWPGTAVVGRYNRTANGSYISEIRTRKIVTPDGDLKSKMTLNIKAMSSLNVNNSLFPDDYSCSTGNETVNSTDGYQEALITDDCGEGTPQFNYTLNYARNVRYPDGGTLIETMSNCEPMYSQEGQYIGTFATYMISAEPQPYENTSLIPCGIPICTPGPGCEYTYTPSSPATLAEAKPLLNQALLKRLSKMEKNEQRNCNHYLKYMCSNNEDPAACWERVAWGGIAHPPKPDFWEDRYRARNSLIKLRLGIQGGYFSTDSKGKKKPISGKVKIYVPDFLMFDVNNWNYPVFSSKSPCCDDDPEDLESTILFEQDFSIVCEGPGSEDPDKYFYSNTLNYTINLQELSNLYPPIPYDHPNGIEVPPVPRTVTACLYEVKG